MHSVVRTEWWVLRQPFASMWVALHSLQTLYCQCSTSVVLVFWQRLACVRKHSFQGDIGRVRPSPSRVLLPSGIACRRPRKHLAAGRGPTCHFGARTITLSWRWSIRVDPRAWVQRRNPPPVAVL